MNDIVIIGAGGLGREVSWLIEHINQVTPIWNFLGFVDDNIHDCNVDNDEKLGVIKDYVNYRDAYFVFALGNPTLKMKIDKMYPLLSKFATLIHPSAIIAKDAFIDSGSIVCANTIVSSKTLVAKHVLVNWNCTLGHDSVLGSYVSVMPGVNISGNVKIGDESFVGTGVKISNNVDIGYKCTLGPGSVVINSVVDLQTVFGNPARVFFKKGL